MAAPDAPDAPDGPNPAEPPASGDRRRPPVVSVVTPTYNEAPNVEPLLDGLRAALEGIPHEIVVVDDDSPDRTWELAEDYAARHPQVRVIRRFGESGLSSAVMAGMGAARGEVIAVIDADRQHDEAALPEMVRRITDGEADVVVGSRAGDGGSYGDFGPLRRLISFVAATIARLFLRVPVSDPMSGYFAVSRETLRRVGPSINPQGFKILLEFIGRRDDLRVAEVGYRFRNRVAGETKLSPSVIRSYLLAVAELRLGRQVKGQFFLYALVGLVGLAVNLVTFALFELIDLGAVDLGFSRPVRWSLLAGIEASILSNFLLNNYFTFWERRFRRHQLWWGLALFHVVSLVGVGIHVGLFQFLQAEDLGVAAIGAGAARLAHEAVGFAAAFVSNYFLNVNYTWRRRREV